MITPEDATGRVQAELDSCGIVGPTSVFSIETGDPDLVITGAVIPTGENDAGILVYAVGPGPDDLVQLDVGLGAST